MLQTIESREVGSNLDEAVVLVGQLNMIDLAGSERARQTGSTGERFKEDRYINLSLSKLNFVIK
jgi:centromeric protein E